MSIEFIKGDVTEPKFDTKFCIIIHGVNDTGYAFGSGVAGAITRKWPSARQDYLNIGKGETLELGCLFFSKVEENIYICHLVSQNGLISNDNPKPAKTKAILDGLKNLMAMNLPFHKITIVSPKIGCGLGGLSWEEVEPIYESVFKDHTVYIYEFEE